MREETKALLVKCRTAKGAELCQSQLVAEVRALNRKLGSMMTLLTELRVEHAEVQAFETDRSVRGQVYQLGSKIGGIESRIRKAQVEVQHVLEGLRDLDDLTEQLNKAFVETPAPVPVETEPALAVGSAAPTGSLRTSNTEARIARGLAAAPGGEP